MEALEQWLHNLSPLIAKECQTRLSGDRPRWEAIVGQLPALKTKHVKFNQAQIQIGDPLEIDEAQRVALKNILKQFPSWRKGPWNLWGIEIDSEWNCDFKWDRFRRANISLENQTILDVGCGNGYYLARMLAEGARAVVGLEPTWQYVSQFRAIEHFCPPFPWVLLPLSLENCPVYAPGFDCVFSMGVLYHCRNPLEHLQVLRQQMNPQGCLVLETLVIPGKNMEWISPREQGNKRYAQMKNVWYLPTQTHLINLIQQAGFSQVEVVDLSKTTVQEQRSTEWINFGESLEHFLNPSDSSQTIEGYPAPQRLMLRIDY